MAIMQSCPRCKAKSKVATKICRCGEKLDAAKRSGRVKFYNDFYLPGGKRRREYVGMSIDDARAAEGKRRGQKREGRIFEMIPDSKKTFAELGEWYLDNDKVKGMAYFKATRRHLDIFNVEYGGLSVGDLRLEHLQSFQVKALRGLQRKVKNSSKKDYAESYVDQIVDTVKAAVTLALDNDKIGGDLLKPFRKLRGLLRKGANARKRVLTPAEYRELAGNLKSHLKPVAAAGWWSGMRQGEILKLTWDKVDLTKRLIHLKAEDTKENKPKVVPIARPLRDILLALPGRAAGGFVFTYAGKPVRDITEGIEAACVASGIVYGRFTEGGFVFHDLRRGFITYARKAGVARNVIMAITGHSGGRGDMNIRYDQIDTTDLLTAIDQIEGMFSANSDQTSDKRAGEPCK
jgi:integrase